LPFQESIRHASACAYALTLQQLALYVCEAIVTILFPHDDHVEIRDYCQRQERKGETQSVKDDVDENRT
jgi:hypothetical protein